MPEPTVTSTSIEPPHPQLVSFLARNADGILEQVAQKFDVSTFDVVHALPPEHATTVGGDTFAAVMADIAAWGDVMMIVHTANIVLECKGPIPTGTFGRGYFNIHGDGPIGGHIKAERCKHIVFVSRPFMGRQSCSIQFFDKEGEAMFKVFVRRDAERNLVAEQVALFETLRAGLCD